MSVKRNIKKMALAAMLAGMLGSLTGCFIQPDPTLDPLQISDGTVPFGTVQALPTNTPTPVPQSTPSPTPDTWQSSDQSTWEDWSSGSLPTTTPKTAATAAPGAQSWRPPHRITTRAIPCCASVRRVATSAICRRG